MTFQDINLTTPLWNALEELGYTNPTTIQHRVFPVAMSGRDICGIAQTGTGKTFAYLLPCLKLWKYDKNKDPQILILVPTRELVTQVISNINELTKYMSLTAVGVYGGVNMNTQRINLVSGADIIVATPGRLYDLILVQAFKTKNIKKLVIDEVDEMLNLGFRTQLRNIIDLLPTKRQNLLFSATITEEVEALMHTYFNDPIRVEAAPTGTPLENIEQVAYTLPNFNTKVNMLEYLLQQDRSMEKVLVFAATKSLADELYTKLEPNLTGKIGVIHSNKEQNHRFNTVVQFENGTYKTIIATDIVARGLDITDVTHVINFDVPEVPENYIHRIGRTGRFDKKGIAITFITKKEKPFIDVIESLMQFKIPVQNLPADLPISTILIDAEIPKIFMRNTLVKTPKIDAVGPAFHAKKAKNTKVNVTVSKKDKMQKKYGKPIKRGVKKR
jgi:ATP-dependent RNA helicase RhlE